MIYPFYQHQLEAIEHITNEQGNCLIADPPRLGKTAPAIAYAYEQRQLPCLIVCPNSVVIKWQREIKNITGLDAIIIKNGKSGIDDKNRYNFIIIPYSLIVSQAQQLKDYHFFQIIYDEAHRLKNSKTAVAKAVHQYLKLTPSILLTGTPILNAPKELWSLFLILGIEQQFAYNEFMFQKEYCNGHYEYIHVRGGSIQKVWRADGLSNEWKLKQLINKYTGYLRRSFNEVWGNNHQKILQGNEYLDIKLTKEQDKILSVYANTGKQSTEIKSIRRDIGVKKLNKSITWIKDWLKYNTGKLIVFSHHQDVQQGLIQAFDNIKKCVIIGGMTNKTRSEQVDLFQQDNSCKLALLSVKAASEGITLDKADTVCFVEYDYTPATNEQAMNRGYSIDRDTPLNVTFLIVPNSYDERILEIMQGKELIIKEII